MSRSPISLLYQAITLRIHIHQLHIHISSPPTPPPDPPPTPPPWWYKLIPLVIIKAAAYFATL